MTNYTLTEALALPAGRDLDACIEREVFGSQVFEVLPEHYFYRPAGKPKLRPVPHYSTSWADAGPLLQVMPYAQLSHNEEPRKPWTCDFNAVLREDSPSGETPMLAICRAALVLASERGKKE